jgi:hypothetical protein
LRKVSLSACCQGQILSYRNIAGIFRQAEASVSSQARAVHGGTIYVAKRIGSRGVAAQLPLTHVSSLLRLYVSATREMRRLHYSAVGPDAAFFYSIFVVIKHNAILPNRNANEAQC